MSGLRSRRKGHNWEREVARRFRDIFGEDVKRGWQSRSGDDAPDVCIPHFWVECKRGKRTNPRAALRQANEASSKAHVPLAVCKDDREDAFIVMSFDDYLDLVTEWWQLKNM